MHSARRMAPANKLFLRACIADLAPLKGEIWLNGPPKALARPRPAGHCQSRCAANRGCCSDMSVIDASRRPDAVSSARSGLSAGAASASRVDLLDAPVAQLSTGEKQRLSLVRALLPNPLRVFSWTHIDRTFSSTQGFRSAPIEVACRERIRGTCSERMSESSAGGAQQAVSATARVLWQRDTCSS